MALDAGEEMERLGGHAVPAAGYAHQAVKCPDRFQVAGEFDLEVALLGFADGPACRAFEAGENRGLASGQIQPMAMKAFGSRHVAEKSPAAAAFKVFPIALPGVGQCSFVQDLE